MIGYSDRAIKSFGVSLGSKTLKTHKKILIEDVIQGEWQHDLLGDFFKVNEIYSIGYQHGRMNLVTDFNFFKPLQVSGLSVEGITLKDIIFMDIETTGLSGGTGTMAFLLGMGYFTKIGFAIDQFFLADPVNELAFLDEIENIFSHYKVIVTFNGSSFDIPLLKSRFILNRSNSPFINMSHLDLLHFSRKIWKLRLPSMKLKDLENEVLEFRRNETEVHGWMVPQIYFDFLRSKDARPLEGVFYHNRMDVLSMAFIFTLAAQLLSDPLKNRYAPKEDLLSIARMLEDYGYSQQSEQLYRSLCDIELPENIPARALLHFGLVCRKQRNYDLAVKFWMSSFDKGDYRAAIEISKFHEYRNRDYQSALKWARLGLDLLRTVQTRKYKYTSMEDDITKRINRLRCKMSKDRP